MPLLGLVKEPQVREAQEELLLIQEEEAEALTFIVVDMIEEGQGREALTLLQIDLQSFLLQAERLFLLLRR